MTDGTTEETSHVGSAGKPAGHNVHGVRFGGEVSPTSLLANALRVAPETEIAVVVRLNKAGEFHVGWTKANGFKLLGMMYAALRELERSLEGA